MKLSDVHPLQADSLFRLYRMPEQTRDLETTASLMRSVFGCGEQNGLLASKGFSGEIYTRDVEKTLDTLDSCSQSWAGQTLLAEGLAVPPSERETPARAGSVLTLVPLTPMIAKHACFTRKQGNPWNPGGYIEGMLLRGARTEAAAAELWSKLASAFSVSSPEDTHGSDPWAQLVERVATEIMEEEFLGPASAVPLCRSKAWAAYPGEWIENLGAYPAGAFFGDLSSLIDLEPLVTRRAWIGIVDSFLRLAISADMLWVGRMNRGLVELLKSAHAEPSHAEIDEAWVCNRFRAPFYPFAIGAHCEKALRQEVREFAKAQLFVRSYLTLLPEDSITNIESVGGLSSVKGLILLARTAQQLSSSALDTAETLRGQVIDDNPDMMSLKGSKTWTHQLYFALRYGLGQRSAKSEASRHFDQGYWCRKSGPARNQSWHFDISPVGIFLMVHLITAGKEMATAADLKQKLGEYGIAVSIAEISRGAIGSSLRQLGLVTDSPDAEGGMVLRSPFFRQDAQ